MFSPQPLLRVSWQAGLAPEQKRQAAGGVLRNTGTGPLQDLSSTEPEMPALNIHSFGLSVSSLGFSFKIQMLLWRGTSHLWLGIKCTGIEWMERQSCPAKERGPAHLSPPTAPLCPFVLLCFSALHPTPPPPSVEGTRSVGKGQASPGFVVSFYLGRPNKRESP